MYPKSNQKHEPMTFRVLASERYNPKVKIGAFGLKPRNPNFLNKIPKIGRLPRDL